MKLHSVLAAGAAIMLSCATTFAQSPKREFRSVWLTTYSNIDWPSKKGTSASMQKLQKEELIKYLDDHAKRNFTTILFHVRTCADAVYKSSYEPFSEYVSGTRGVDPGWDPLEFVVEECHKRGLECYAWMNPFRLSANSKQQRNTPTDKMLRENGWIIDNGKGYETFNPAIPEAREYILKVIKEVYTNYRIDGLLFDDYFYPNGIPEDETAGDWKDYIAADDGTSFGDWRRENINSFMRDLYEQISEDRPDLVFGLSPAGISHNNSGYPGADPAIPGTTDWQYGDIYSDPVAWLYDQSIDFISPQIYWFCIPGNNSYTTAAPFEKLVSWWTKVSKHYDRYMYASLAPYRMADSNGKPVYNNESHWSDLDKQIKICRTYNGSCVGQAYFSAKYMDGPLCSGWGEYLQENAYQQKAISPRITWKERPEIAKPDAKREGNVISWTPADQSGIAPIMRYTVYAVPATVSIKSATGADGISNAYLLDVVYGGSYTIPADRRSGYWYAVCAFDGYGFESEPAVIEYDPTLREEITKDEAAYPEADGLKIESLWYRAVNGAYSYIDFPDNGNGNRGVAVAGGSVFVSGRSDNSAQAVATVNEYDIETGELLNEYNIDFPAVAYKCNDIVSDNNGKLYINNLVLNINDNPLYIYSFDPATGATAKVAELTMKQTRATKRVDHVDVEDLGEGRLHVYAALSGSADIVRWTVDNGNTTDEEIMTAAKMCPQASKDFGISARVFHVAGDTVVVDAGLTYPAEYDFQSGELIAGIDAGELIPDGATTSGFVTFGPDNSFMAYPAADTYAEGGIRFNVVRGNGDAFTDSRRLWTLPQTGMGANHPQYITGAAPVAARTVTTENGWYSDVAFLAPGNALAVYRISPAGQDAVEEVEAAVDYTVIGGRAWFVAPGDVCIYTTAGQLVKSEKNVLSVELPEVAGIYILTYNGKALRIAVR